MNWITLIGLIAAFCSTISFVPQAMKTIKTKEVRDLSLGMYILFSMGSSFWVLYAILTKDLPVFLANSIVFIFVFTVLILIIKYKDKKQD